MHIKTVKVGYLETNCYILFKNNECLIIDPGDEVSKIVQEIDDHKVVGILITHSHPDHIGAVEELQKHYSCPIYNYENLDEKQYHLGSFAFEVIYTPGHTSDSVSYYFDNESLFTGDFLFKGTVGRTDLPTGNFNALMRSIEKIKVYPSHIKIYPGHDDNTTLKDELAKNPYLN